MYTTPKKESRKFQSTHKPSENSQGPCPFLQPPSSKCTRSAEGEEEQGIRLSFVRTNGYRYCIWFFWVSVIHHPWLVPWAFFHVGFRLLYLLIPLFFLNLRSQVFTLTLQKDAKPFLELLFAGIPARSTLPVAPKAELDGARRRFDALRNLMRYVNELSMYPISTSLYFHLDARCPPRPRSSILIFFYSLFLFLFLSFTVVLPHDHMAFTLSFSLSLAFLLISFSPSDGSEYPKIRDERPFCNWLFSSSSEGMLEHDVWCVVSLCGSWPMACVKAKPRIPVHCIHGA